MSLTVTNQHETEQLRFIAENTTAQERMQWLEDTLFFLWRNGMLKSLLPEDEDAARTDVRGTAAG